MKNEKQELLNNPLVREIAKDFYLHKLGATGFVCDADWKEFSDGQQPKPGWEIVAYKLTLGSVYYKTVTGMFRGSNDVHPRGLSFFEDMYGKINADTYSVKRLSDGEVFSVGDKVKYRPRGVIQWTIASFFIRGDGVMLVRSKDSEMVEAFDNDLTKVKTPLFTTEDGKAVFEGDEIYAVFTKHGFGFDIWGVWPWGAMAKSNWDDTVKRFSTKKAAEEYVLMNKPCLTLGEVLGMMLNEHEEDEITEIAKSKISQ